MAKALSALVVVLFSMSTYASIATEIINFKELQNSAQAQVTPLGLDWKVGDFADYSFKVSFINGKIHSFVRDLTADGFWVQQDVDAMIQKQKVEILFDKNTGEIKKILVDGKEQQIPENGDMEVIDMREDRLTVPAGTFECVYIKIKNNDDNSESEAWINPELIPISGALKQLSQSQMGPVEMALTKFKKN